MRNRYVWIALSVAVATVAVAVAVSAGNPDSPPGPPESTLSYTLEDIYQRLDTGAAGAPIAFTEPISGPGTGTMHTLTDMMDLAPVVDEANGAVPAQVLTGKTAWGLTSGQWGVMTGTMPDNGAVSYTPSTITQTVVAGYHDGSGKVVGDADLVSGNVRSGVDLFGVSGDPNVVDTSSGDAVSGEILRGKKAWVDGIEVTGTVPPAPAPKTGQTGCWAEPGTAISCAGTGQDGEYQKGVAWPSPRFITSTTGVVTDVLTGLVWLQNANCGGNQTWEDALTFANSLYDGWTGDGSGGDCGLSDGSSAGDWRLPNLRELQSLLDYSQYNPVLPTGHPFTDVQLYLYWSSTTRALDTSQAWLVYLSHGTVSVAYKAIQYFSWPVRDGQ